MMISSIKLFYENNKKVSNIVIALIGIGISVIYFNLFFQRGIRYNKAFYKQELQGEKRIYKKSQRDYFTVDKTQDIYLVTIQAPNDSGTIAVQNISGNLYEITYPDNITFRGRLIDTYFFNEDGTPDFDDMYDFITGNETVLDRPFNKRYGKSFIMGIVFGKTLVFRGNLNWLFTSFLFIIVGGLQMKYPKQMELLGTRWKFKNNLDDLELSDTYMQLNRFVNIIVFIIAIILLIAALV
jgi:hypothetical protein